MLKTIILDAGHSLRDPGATAGQTTEAREAIKVRDLLVPLLAPDFTVVSVPDNLDLIQSIAWVNSRYKNLDDGLGLAIHFNASGQGDGAETYYYGGEAKSQKIAQTMIDKYCALTRFRNRGAKPDTSTRFGRLGWIRDLKPWSCLIELCFLDNPAELAKLQSEYQEIAQALYEAICAVYGVKPNKPADVSPLEPVNLKTRIKNKIKELSDLVEGI